MCSDWSADLRRDIIARICAMRSPGLRLVLKDARAFIWMGLQKRIIVTWLQKLSLAHKLSQLGLRSKALEIHTILTRRPCPWLWTLRVHTHTRARSARCQGNRMTTSTRRFTGFHYFQETRGPPGYKLATREHQAAGPRQTTLTDSLRKNALRFSRKNPGPCVPPPASLAHAAIGLAANWREESLRDCAIVIVVNKISQLLPTNNPS